MKLLINLKIMYRYMLSTTIKFTVKEVFNGLNFLDLNPCPELDGLLNILLHLCKYSLSVPISKIFNRSLILGVFPHQ